jgi:hypothetical protein
MERTAKQLNFGMTDVFSGNVKSILENKYLIADEYGRVTRAEKAASCLLAPQIGDFVLAANVGEKSFLVAVLEKQNAATSSISLDGDVNMTVPNGKLNITAKDGMTLGTPEELSLIAGRLGLSGDALLAAFQKIEVFGDAVEAGLTTVKLFSKRLESKVESAVQQFVRRHAKVEGLDSVKAGSIRQTAESIFSIRSAFSFLKADKNVKIDGKQIFMG